MLMASWQAAAWRLERRLHRGGAETIIWKLWIQVKRREIESVKRSISTPPRTWPSLLSAFAEAKLIPEQLLLGACTFDVTEESQVVSSAESQQNVLVSS